MTTIVEFLLARIAEDEATAGAADPACWVSDVTWQIARVERAGAEADHIRRHDPARVVAECETKRRIVERCRPQYAVLYRESERLLASAFDQETMKTIGHSGPRWPFEDAEAILRDLAAVYADHPDYLEEWRP